MVTLASLKPHKEPSLLASVPCLQYNGLSLLKDRYFGSPLATVSVMNKCYPYAECMSRRYSSPTTMYGNLLQINTCLCF